MFYEKRRKIVMTQSEFLPYSKTFKNLFKLAENIKDKKDINTVKKIFSLVKKDNNIKIFVDLLAKVEYMPAETITPQEWEYIVSFTEVYPAEMRYFYTYEKIPTIYNDRIINAIKKSNNDMSEFLPSLSAMRDMLKRKDLTEKQMEECLKFVKSSLNTILSFNKRPRKESPFSQEVYRYMAQKDEFKNFFIYSYISDKKIIEDVLDNDNIDEDVALQIVNNENMPSEIRNRAFDIGCDWNQIIHPTKQMLKTFYEKCMESLAEAEENKSPCHDANNFLIHCFQNPKMSESCQIDFLEREKNKISNGDTATFHFLRKIMENTSSAVVIKKLLEFNNSYILSFIAYHNSNVYKYEDITKELCERTENRILNEIDRNCFSITSQEEKAYIEILKEIPPLNKEVLPKMIDACNTSDNCEYAVKLLLQSPYLSSDVVDKLADKQPLYAPVCKLYKECQKNNAMKFYQNVHRAIFKENVTILKTHMLLRTYEDASFYTEKFSAKIHKIFEEISKKSNPENKNIKQMEKVLEKYDENFKLYNAISNNSIFSPEFLPSSCLAVSLKKPYEARNINEEDIRKSLEEIFQNNFFILSPERIQNLILEKCLSPLLNGNVEKCLLNIEGYENIYEINAEIIQKKEKEQIKEDMEK